ncbi:hypothetical protein N665_1135s0002 [Sinapis alba]|nr:hypothetical protein N665_1135s0002 [Sinapis alba]
MSFGCPGKTSWPELVGSNEEEATLVIKDENSSVEVVVILDPIPVLGDFICNRVIVPVNEERIVVRTPTVG